MSLSAEGDVRCSNACTRAGIALLLLSAVCLGMIEPLDKTRELSALITYTSARLVLHHELERLKDDVAWRGLMASPSGKQASTSWTLDKLLDYTFLYSPPPATPPPERPKSPSIRIEPKPPKPGLKNAPPAVPSNLRVGVQVPIEPLHNLVDALDHLGNGETLSLARRYSTLANVTILSWARLRYRFLLDAIARQNPGAIVLPKKGDVGPAVVPSVSRDEQVRSFTYPQLVELANLGAPKSGDLDALIKEQRSVTLPSVGVPIGLLPSTTILGFAILVAFGYFWLYYAEARCSPRFPAEGTLFGVFARTRTRRILFFWLTILPLTATAAIAVKSFWVNSLWIRYGNRIVVVLVAVVTVLVWLQGRLPSLRADADVD